MIDAKLRLDTVNPPLKDGDKRSSLIHKRVNNIKEGFITLDLRY
jgi:hypothetical protein